MRSFALGLLVTLTLLSIADVADAADEVRVLRGKRRLTGLSGTGAGGTIEKLDIEVDLKVKNLAFQKVVGIRWSADDGATWKDANAYWVANFEDGSEHWRVALNVGTI